MIAKSCRDNLGRFKKGTNRFGKPTFIPSPKYKKNDKKQITDWMNSIRPNILGKNNYKWNGWQS